MTCKDHNADREAAEKQRSRCQQPGYVPDWRNQTKPFSDAASCTYQIPVRTQYESFASQLELQNVQQEYRLIAAETVLKYANKVTTEQAVAEVAAAVEARDYNIETRPIVGRLCLLYVVAQDVVSQQDDAYLDEPTWEDSRPTIATQTLDAYHTATDALADLDKISHDLENIDFYKHQARTGLKFLADHVPTIKTAVDKVKEEYAYNSSTKTALTQVNKKTVEFAGDAILTLLLSTGLPPELAEMYSKILNHINVDDLLAAILECISLPLPTLPALPRLPTLPHLPENLPIVDFLSWLIQSILEAIWALIMSLLRGLIDDIIADILEYCEFLQQNINYGLTSTYDMFSDTVLALLFGNDRAFLDDTALILTPVEFADLLQGWPSDEVWRAVMALPSAPDENEAANLFGTLKQFVKEQAIADAYSSIPRAALTYCEPSIIDLRTELLYKRRGLTPSQVQTEVDRARARREQKAATYSKLLQSPTLLEDFAPVMLDGLVSRDLPSVQYAIDQMVRPNFININTFFGQDLQTLIDAISRENLQAVQFIVKAGISVSIAPSSVLFAELVGALNEPSNFFYNTTGGILRFFFSFGADRKVVYSLPNASGRLIDACSIFGLLEDTEYSVNTQRQLNITNGQGTFPAQVDAMAQFFYQQWANIGMLISPIEIRTKISAKLFPTTFTMFAQVLAAEIASSSFFVQRAQPPQADVKLVIPPSQVVYKWLLESKYINFEPVLDLIQTSNNEPFRRSDSLTLFDELLQNYHNYPLEEGEGFGELLQRVTLEQLGKAVARIYNIETLIKAVFAMSVFTLETDQFTTDLLQSLFQQAIGNYADLAADEDVAVVIANLRQVITAALQSEPLDVNNYFMTQICKHVDVPHVDGIFPRFTQSIRNSGGFILERYIRIAETPNAIEGRFGVRNIDEWSNFLNTLEAEDLTPYFSSWKFGYRISYVLGDQNGPYSDFVQQHLVAIPQPNDVLDREKSFVVWEARDVSPNDYLLYTMPLLTTEWDVPIARESMDMAPTFDDPAFYLSRLQQEPDYDLVFGYLFPLERILSLLTLYTIEVAEDFANVDQVFSATMKLIRAFYGSIQCAKDYSFNVQEA